MSKALEILELRNQVAKLVTEVRNTMEFAKTEKRDIGAEERTKIENLETEIDKLDSRIELEERQLNRERKIEGTTKEIIPGKSDKDDEVRKLKDSKEYRSAFEKFITQGKDAVYTSDETRAMQLDNALTGGAFASPTSYVNELIKDIDNATVIRGLARVFNVGLGQTMGAPSLDNDVDDADWTAEIQAASETADIKFGERELTPHQLSKLVKLSNKLIAGGTQSVEALVRERLAYKFGITQEKTFMSGTGANQPLGLFTASPLGISTSYDISTDNTTTAITGNGLMEALYDLKEGYQKNATFLFHRLAVKQIRKLKDSNGQYLWQPALTGGNPNTILDKPYVTSEYVPNTFTTGLYVGLVGDFKYYWICDAQGVLIQVLKELYSLTNQTGYIARAWVDGMPVLGSAFRRIKLG
jgi:HK97 family phage major capsid protein